MAFFPNDVLFGITLLSKGCPQKDVFYFKQQLCYFYSMIKSFRDKDLQLFVGNILRLGVIISMAIVAIGLSLYLIQHGHTANDYSIFVAGDFSFNQFFQDLFHGKSEAIIGLGVICLIFTPIMRVLFAIIGFWLEGDRRYTVISIIILVIIIISMLLGAVE